MIGQTIAHYHILEKLGEGGMGVVYKARDTHLDRFVALKVLPPEKTANPERKSRFVREAKAASALNHPNIVTIHDITSDDGVDYIVMEFIAGQTLDKMIPRGGLPVGELLGHAVEIADALEAAHSSAIIHRDLKPANVMVSDSGRVKVLDFGLAKLMEPAVGGDLDATPTVDIAEASETVDGAIIGTCCYMSPEQAEGKRVDARSDIFSFGALLYEMACGRRAFDGESKISMLAAVLNKEPAPVTSITEEAPSELGRIVSRCLRKDPGRRFQHAADLKVALLEIKEESESGTTKLAGPLPTRRRRSWVWPAAVVATIAVVAAMLWVFRSQTEPTGGPMVVTPLTTEHGWEMDPAYSPDGNQIAFVRGSDLLGPYDVYVKLIDAPTSLQLTNTPADERWPIWSPDGRSIAFARVAGAGRHDLVVIPVLGGPERHVARVSARDRGIRVAWTPDSKWLITGHRDQSGEGDGLYLFPVEGGEKRRLTTPPVGLTDLSPSVSPDGKKLAFNRSSARFAREIHVLALAADLSASGEPVHLTHAGDECYDPVWSADGRDLICSSGVRGNTRILRISADGRGGPRRLFPSDQSGRSPAVDPLRGTLVYVRDLQNPNIHRLELSSTGDAASGSQPLLASTLVDTNPHYSPDGSRIAFVSNRSGGARGIWLAEPEGSNAAPLYANSGFTGSPRWSPDGRRIAFDNNVGGDWEVYVIGVNGGKPRQITDNTGEDTVPRWSVDGGWLYFGSDRTGEHQVWKVPVDDDGAAGEAIQVTQGGGYAAMESPDGRFVYFTTEYLGGTLRRILVDGGEETDVLGSVLLRNFWVTASGIYFASESDGSYSIRYHDLKSGDTKTLAEREGSLGHGFCIAPDGQYLLYTPNDQSGSDLVLVRNFR